MRLIDADALAMHLADWQLSSGEEERDVIEEAIRAINEAPTIDAVPVIRCRDCKYWGKVGTVCRKLDNVMFWYGTDPTDFCSFAERRNDE